MVWLGSRSVGFRKYHDASLGLGGAFFSSARSQEPGPWMV